MSTHLVLIHALSPVHCGTGQATSGIDLPIARERPTGTPLIPGSTLKGVLRSQGDVRTSETHKGAFGPDTFTASEHAGGVQFGDARLLALPVRSVSGTFGWVTSPELLRRFARDLHEAGKSWPLPPAPPSDKDALVAGDRLTVKVDGKERIIFEDFDFAARRSTELEGFAKALAVALFGADSAAEIKHFVERICVVGDDVMRVLGRVGMEVVTRNHIDEATGTVADGQLWSEEALPVESVLAGLIVATPVRASDDAATLIAHVRWLCKRPIQLGGKSTVGRGVCRVEVL